MFSQLFVIALCIASCFAAPEFRIIGGSVAKENQFPHQVSLRRFGTHTCGGSILNENFVLTAAHCVADASGSTNPTSFYAVIAGTNYLDKGGVRRYIKKVTVHENYRNDLNDVALIELSEPLEFSDSIKPIEIADEVEIPAGSDIIISGWGRTSDGGPLSNALKFNTLSAITQKECAREIYINYAGLICLGHKQNNGICSGDSGGPALYNGKLVGVASFIVGRCGSTDPDGYAKVPFFKDWISKRIAA